MSAPSKARSQSMPPSRTASRMASAPAIEASRSHVAGSAPKRLTSVPMESSQPLTQPPLRPEAPAPQNSRSSRTTSASGARRLIQ